MSIHSDSGVMLMPEFHPRIEASPDYCCTQLSQVELACCNVLGTYKVRAALEAVIGSKLQPLDDVENDLSHAMENFDLAIDCLQNLRPYMLQDVYAKARVVSVLASSLGKDDLRLLTISLEVATELVRFERQDPASP